MQWAADWVSVQMHIPPSFFPMFYSRPGPVMTLREYVRPVPVFSAFVTGTLLPFGPMASDATVVMVSESMSNVSTGNPLSFFSQPGTSSFGGFLADYASFFAYPIAPLTVGPFSTGSASQLGFTAQRFYDARNKFVASYYTPVLVSIGAVIPQYTLPATVVGDISVTSVNTTMYGQVS